MPTWTGQITISGDNILFGYDGFAPYWEVGGNPFGIYNDHLLILRFSNVTIPPGAVVSSAFVTVRQTSNVTSFVTNELDVYGILQPDPPAFTSSTDFNSRPRVNGDVVWTIPHMSPSTDYSSPDITSLIQPILAQTLWASGNHLAIFLDGFHNLSSANSNCAVVGEDGLHPPGTPRLSITYTQGTTGGGGGPAKPALMFLPG